MSNTRPSASLAIVTGASRGLGRAIAEQLAGEGVTVLGLSRQAPPGPNGLEQWPCDLADPAPVAARLAAWLGTFALDRFASAALINNAALITDPAPLRDVDLAVLSASARIGLEAPLLLTAAFLKATRAWSGQRRVLHISSGLGRRAMASTAAYCAVKAGLDHLARALALEEALLPHGAKICSLAPGVIDTDMQVQLRGADPRGFPDRETFVQMKSGGRLDTPAAAAAKVIAYLRRPDFGANPVGDVRDA
jgi:NAD(P)-dependent dehydrogenase (short-subunit alcohol dehydrogenase family)